MTKKLVFVFLILIVCCVLVFKMVYNILADFPVFVKSSDSSWEVVERRSFDVGGDLNDEVIVKLQLKGPDHYGVSVRERISIFRMERNYSGPMSQVEIFSLPTLVRSCGVDVSEGKYDIIRDVHFSDTDMYYGKAIVVDSKKIYYKDEQNKIVDREEDLGRQVYKWNRSKFEQVTVRELKK